MMSFTIVFALFASAIALPAQSEVASDSSSSSSSGFNLAPPNYNLNNINSAMNPSQMEGLQKCMNSYVPSQGSFPAIPGSSSSATGQDSSSSSSSSASSYPSFGNMGNYGNPQQYQQYQDALQKCSQQMNIPAGNLPAFGSFVPSAIQPSAAA